MPKNYLKKNNCDLENLPNMVSLPEVLFFMRLSMKYEHYHTHGLQSTLHEHRNQKENRYGNR